MVDLFSRPTLGLLAGLLTGSSFGSTRRTTLDRDFCDKCSVMSEELSSKHYSFFAKFMF